MATLAMPLTSVLASSATRSSVNCSGSSAHPLLDLVADLVVAEPAADERQVLELVDGLGELVGELAGLGDGPRPEHAATSSVATAMTPSATMATAMPAAHREAALEAVDERVEGEGDERRRCRCA